MARPSARPSLEQHMAEIDHQDAVIESLFRYTHAITIALGHRDEDTRLHSDRVSMLSAELGRYCGLTPRELGFLRLAAALHDVGKIGVPDAVLSKPGKLDAEEWAAMRSHSVIGEDIVLAIGIEGSADAAKIIRHHHENWDGQGYPDGLAGTAIPLASRIISITDSYDAMAVTRPYHRPRTHSCIMETMQAESGRKHDPALLEMFCELIESSRYRVR
jgi:HD-GYP domain-containing protein (c-di-GMP phosphodiesterase class II)